MGKERYMMENLIAVALLALILMMIILVLMILSVIFTIRHMFKRALTFVFTFRLKPKFEKIR